MHSLILQFNLQHHQELSLFKTTALWDCNLAKGIIVYNNNQKEMQIVFHITNITTTSSRLDEN